MLLLLGVETAKRLSKKKKKKNPVLLLSHLISIIGTNDILLAFELLVLQCPEEFLM